MSGRLPVCEACHLLSIMIANDTLGVSETLIG